MSYCVAFFPPGLEANNIFGTPSTENRETIAQMEFLLQTHVVNQLPSLK